MRHLKSSDADNDAERNFLRSRTNVNTAADYIEDLQTNGRLVFTTNDAVRALGKAAEGSCLSK